jgi:hypothetical protein
MKKLYLILPMVGFLALSGCDKYGSGGGFSHLLGNWAQVNLPDGCVAKQIAVEENSGVAVLCEDGRVFH